MYPEKIAGAILQMDALGYSTRVIILILKKTWKFKASKSGVNDLINRETK
jgi:hypothetical protein